MSGMFSRCAQTTVGTPSASKPVTTLASRGCIVRSSEEESGTMKAGSTWTGAPMWAA
jgi:hypothetical protein